MILPQLKQNESVNKEKLLDSKKHCRASNTCKKPEEFDATG